MSYTPPEEGERVLVGLSTWCSEPATNLTEDVSRHPPSVAPIAAHPELAVQPQFPHQALDEDVEVWTLHNPNNAAFSLPNGTKGDVSAVMLQAF